MSVAVAYGIITVLIASACWEALQPVRAKGRETKSRAVLLVSMALNFAVAVFIGLLFPRHMVGVWMWYLFAGAAAASIASAAARL